MFIYMLHIYYYTYLFIIHLFDIAIYSFYSFVVNYFYIKIPLPSIL
jgi:hypothetical protein